MGHFRVPPGLCIKTRLSAQPLIWKCFFIHHAKKTHFQMKGCALGLMLNVRVVELGSGLLFVFCNGHNSLQPSDFKSQASSQLFLRQHESANESTNQKPRQLSTAKLLENFSNR